MGLVQTARQSRQRIGKGRGRLGIFRGSLFVALDVVGFSVEADAETREERRESV